MSARARLGASESQAHSDQNELDTFRSESEAAARASAQPCLFVSVPAYPARSHPTSPARSSSPGSPAHVSRVVVGPRVITSVLRSVRWIVLAPVRLCAAGVAAIARAVYAVVAFGGRMVSGAVRGVVALGRGVVAAFAFLVQACVHAVRAGFAMMRTAVSRALRAIAALGRASVGGIVDVAVTTRRICVTGLEAAERRVAAAFALVGNRAAHARRAAVSNGVSAMAGARRASVWGVNTLTAGATASAEWLRGEAAHASSVGRLAGLGAMRAFHHGALVVVAALVGAAVTAGGVLQLSRGPVVQPVAADVRVEAPAEPVVVPVAAAITPPPAANARPVTRPADRDSAAEPRRELSAETVRAIWRKTDTRSLDRGIAAVRTATLALHRCRVEMTASDRAVAHCDVQPRKAAWTIDFRRADERWQIENISTAAR